MSKALNSNNDVENAKLTNKNRSTGEHNMSISNKSDLISEKAESRFSPAVVNLFNKSQHVVG